MVAFPLVFYLVVSPLNQGMLAGLFPAINDPAIIQGTDGELTMKVKWAAYLGIVALAFAASFSAARATPITYTISGPEDVRVTIGAAVTNLTNTLVTITGTGDTDDWNTGSFGADSVDLTNVTVFVQGFGTATVTSSPMVFYAGGGGFGAGFGLSPNGNAFDIESAALSTYDGISNETAVGINHPFSFFGAQLFTTAGRVQIRDSGALYSLTFNAALPEPASITLFALAVSGVFVARRRRAPV
jgi:hypothetical protein